MDKSTLDLDAVRGVTGVDGTARARIERAALQLFAEHGVDGVSIKDIAAAAGLSQGAMYRHFESKEALAGALFETIHRRIFDLVRAAIDEAAGFDDALNRVVRVYCEAADDDPALFSYHLTHMHRFGAQPRADRPDPVGLIAARVKQAMDDGDLPPGDPEIRTAAALGVVLQPAAHRMVGRFDTALVTKSDAFAAAAAAVLRLA
ncbi:TetR/AcrR family transcriptional regulator [Marinicauda salina]|uniref:TetR/AcrR family transcriptional regulator n=1 Tax=Marinicauda salina TaxID=2135793 RepID=A0A2U2BTJ3_9PROT|nr:TetR/AcrR family transcriptional regulator [Marinicauda salina]PWE17324.1 TetR/AcrR family transcriptional regulator [Marinicauda salina]